MSQNGTRSWSSSRTQVSTTDHISLQSTSVATCGYLSWNSIHQHMKQVDLHCTGTPFKESTQPMHRALNVQRSNTKDTYLYLPKPSPSICPHAYPNKRRRTSIRWRYSMRRVFCALHSFNKSSSSSIASNETSSPPKLRSRRASMPDAWWNPKFLDGQTQLSEDDGRRKYDESAV